MSENPLQALCQSLEKISHGVQTHISQLFAKAGIKFVDIHNTNNNNNNNKPLLYQPSSSHKSLNHTNTDASSIFLHPNHDEIPNQGEKVTPVSKEELGRATWTFLHTLGAQYPDKPTRQQKRDVKELMEILSRMYPCKDCADHFKEILRSNPVQAGSQPEFSQWLCHVHNIVNRSLGKVGFQCERVDARWGKLECERRACDLQGISTSFGNDIP